MRIKQQWQYGDNTTRVAWHELTDYFSRCFAV
jgi:hypothetical protein